MQTEEHGRTQGRRQLATLGLDYQALTYFTQTYSQHPVFTLVWGAHDAQQCPFQSEVDRCTAAMPPPSTVPPLFPVFQQPRRFPAACLCAAGDAAVRPAVSLSLSSPPPGEAGHRGNKLGPEQIDCPIPSRCVEARHAMGPT